MARHGARQVAIVLGALGAVGALGAAQSVHPAPTFRSEIYYAQFPVRVLDARGEFVRGLTQADFQIFEDGEHANPNAAYGPTGHTERSSGDAARRAFTDGYKEFHGALRYRSINTIADGKLRINKVTTSRRGARVVHRRSYLAPAALPAAMSAQTDPLLAQVLARMHAYLRDYAKHLPAMIATEKYEQRAGSGVRRQRRMLESDFGLIQVPGDAEWLGFREVRTVNGHAVPDSARRLADLFANPSPVAVQQARRIAVESARFNIGPIFRTINDPTIVLELLDPRHAARMRFTKQGEETIRGRRTWVVKFQEVQSPTVIRTRDLQNQPANGRAWIEPDTGRILRVEATIQPAMGPGNLFGTIDVAFAHNEQLGYAVPVKMTERYTNMNLGVVSSGEAIYGNYRRFSVVTEEELTLQPR